MSRLPLLTLTLLILCSPFLYDAFTAITHAAP
jgi:hypothetical protein